MKVNISQESRYVPEWMGNRDVEDDEQVVVTHRNLSHGERAKYRHVEKTNISIEVAGKTEADIEDQIETQTRRVDIKTWTEDDKIAVACKPTLSGLYDTDDNPIDTWDKLLAAPQTQENQLSVLVAEITAHLATLAAEKDSKNSA